MNCREFEAALDRLLDGTLEGESHACCVRHVASCSSCRELVEPMGPSLVPVAAEPPASLLAAVLAGTSHVSRRARWAATWHQWVLRPRFASEVAYVGVVLLSLSFVTLDRSGVLNGVRSEAGILLDRATSLWEKEKP
jgi:predicted anti-sigma-YlaC factor YlaD